jgi:hypothetical protein
MEALRDSKKCIEVIEEVFICEIQKWKGYTSK